MWTKDFNDSRASIEYSNDKNNIYKNTEYNPNKKHKIINFDDMIAVCLAIKNLNR